MIVGTPRSGTTLVQRLASELPGVRLPPETHFFRSFVRGLLRRQDFPLVRRELVREVEQFMALDTSRGLQLDPERVAARLGGRCATPAALFTTLVRELAGPGRLYGEKTPSHLRWWPVVSRWLPGIRLVAVVRDPRAVVNSYFSAWGARPHGVLAERWAIDQQEVLAAERELGGCRVLVLRYEQVVRETARARRRLAAFLGVPDQLRAAGAALRLPWEVWKEGVDGPVRDDRIGSWEATLPGRVVADIEAITCDEMRTFGYAPSERTEYKRALGATSDVRRRRYRLERARERAAISSLAAAG
ncbi:MAG TPA: sulfotransferase [Thermoleophilaceae bacterium]|nr:sulfotransferase [Thermoleophilaceae bacterium]